MKYLKIFLIFIVTNLLIKEVVFFLLKGKQYDWKEKSCRDKKIRELGEESIMKYNKKHNSKLRMATVLSAQKKKNGTTYYSLRILAVGDMPDRRHTFTKNITSQIYKNPENNNKLKIKVHTEKHQKSFNNY
ncbi:Proteinase inhibitor I25, cystatin domain-containing protein [Strongyloides ratti]|uniref:Proteinase inhibitor I25, cystatin domain-containing protein n=1 Tax=Strongyloides ratti TaxID=34506 RepID=A0A090L0S6_STRRB|nr:Proteinase inhibitor I25, cystatin domain-containing protein [Strongyloides ratti]CEF61099.1 Proteinase inhibitor I25, cystatin domain-containing protein [Strongyloides ratti]